MPTEPTRVPPLMIALAQIGGLLAAINPDVDSPITQEAVTAAIRDVHALRARVEELEAGHAAALHTIGVMACEGLADADRIAELERRAEAAKAQVAAVREHLPDPLDPGWETACVHAVIDIRRALDAAGTPAECKQAAEKLNPPADSSRSRALPVTDVMVQAAINAAEQAGGFAHDTDRGEREQLVRAALKAALGTPATEPDDTQPCDATSNGTRCYKPAGHQTHRGTPGPGQTRWWTDATSTPANSQPGRKLAEAGSKAPAVTDAMVQAAWETWYRLGSLGGPGQPGDDRMHAALTAALAAGTPTTETDSGTNEAP